MSRSNELLSTYKEWENLKKGRPGHAYCSTKQFSDHPISYEEAEASLRIYSNVVSQAVEIYKLLPQAQYIMDKWLGAMDGAEDQASAEGDTRKQVRRIVAAEEVEMVDRLKEAMTTGNGSMGEETIVTEYEEDLESV